MADTQVRMEGLGTMDGPGPLVVPEATSGTGFVSIARLVLGAIVAAVVVLSIALALPVDGPGPAPIDRADDRGVAQVARAQEIQRARADALVRAYEAAWASAQPATWRIAISGTGPALGWVADQQRTWSENAVTGTGPGLVTIAGGN
jgi:hypothetical protein